MTRVFAPTEEQQRIIELVDGCHLVLAPPGTGKTSVLAERIIRLLTREPGATSRILALTYTTKAAEVLRRRIDDAVGGVSRRVTAQTFHAFCLNILQHYGESVGFGPDTTVYDSEDDRLDVLSRALDQEGFSGFDAPRLRAMLGRIGALKRSLTGQAAVADVDLSIVYGAYNRVLRQFKGCDFDDLLWLSWRLLTEVPRVAKHYRRLYPQIMIDEAQDTSRAQYEILRAICGEEHRNVMLVADTDQFIYRFAGASDEWLKAFARDFNAITHNLTANFRCARAIITAANRLIELHPGRISQRGMLPANAAVGRIEAFVYADEPSEARGIADWVQNLLASGVESQFIHAGEDPSVAAEEICVLGRNRYSLDKVREEFSDRAIPHLFNAGQRGLVETATARLGCQGLRLLQNPADRVARESILAEWSRPLLDEGIAELPLAEFFGRLEQVDGARDLARAFRSHVGKLEIGQLMDEVLSLLDSPHESDELLRALLLADARTLRDRWDSYRGHTAPEGRSITGFLGELALAGRSVIEGPGVRILTVHAAKGLEFKAVAVAGLNEGTLPDYRALRNEAEVAEEMRIAYVAVTRASRVLLLTRPSVKRLPSGADRKQDQSRFVSAMGLSMTPR